MAYIILADYLRTIQNTNLQQIIESNDSIRTGSEWAAEAEGISYLRQKYKVDNEFTNTIQWVKTNPYSAFDRVYLDAPVYITTNTYNIADYSVYNGYVYVCNTNATTGTWNAAKWDLLGIRYSLFYALPPFQLFDYKKYYNVGDKVFYNNCVYNCLQQTKTLSHDQAIQYGTYDNIPLLNVFPDDVVNGTQYWHNEGVYIVDANTDITNEGFWKQQDNRDAQMVMYFVDITLYHLHSRIAPHNIPQLRIDRYHAAISWLKMCANGEVTPKLEPIQPKTGGRIRWGSQIKNINSY